MLTNEIKKEIYFPYPKVREIQSNMISDVYFAINNKQDMILHAPTGIGKTIAVLAPALSLAIKNNLTILFLTSRQTQHKIVVDTLKQIKKTFGIDAGCADIIGKKWMCLQAGVEYMPSNYFHDYCKTLREENKCEYYLNSRNQNNQPTFNSKHAIEELKVLGPCHVHDFINMGKDKKMCPYELATLTAANSNVIIADYYYMFNKNIRNSLLIKIKKDIEKIILVVDEAHNLPNRVRELSTHKISSLTIEQSKKDAIRYGNEEIIESINVVENAILKLAKDIKNIGGMAHIKDKFIVEDVLLRDDLINEINKIKKYEDIVSELLLIGEDLWNKEKKGFILSLAKFLESWQGQDDGFARIISKTRDKEPKISLVYRCLDPSIITKEVIEKCYSAILISGTLTPTSMYKDTLGFDESVIQKEYKNPFPKKNRCNLIIPSTTTRFSQRNQKQFSEIAKICSDIVNLVNGNSAIFFPSYELMHNIYENFKGLCNKTIFMEKQKSNKQEKEAILSAFKNRTENDGCAVLLGISTGSFGEGIDLPNLLKVVIIVGLPLQKPNVEIKLLIQYYKDKFGKGFEYGYILPSITKCLQNAGRCIRSETDKGAIIFLDERYIWDTYYNCFPKDWEINISQNYLGILKGFFDRG